MGYFSDGLKALWVTMRNVPRKVVTDGYPEVVRPRAARYRASLAGHQHQASGKARLENHWQEARVRG
jgi:formate hydrogenlyase subunit 6/NADH:ubiquinone oxidoreductase subunit I